MAITFPSTPNTGDIFTSDGRSWQWDGTAWTGYGSFPDPSVFAVDATNDAVSVYGGLSVGASASIAGALQVDGDFTVSGTTTTINTTELNVDDNIITLNSNVTGTPSLDAGIEVERGDETNAQLLWDESAGAWVVNSDFTVDTNTLHVDSTNNRVGIGTTSPAENLDVTGSTSDVSLLLRSGDISTGANNGKQIVLGYDGSASYAHNIRTRHNSSSQAGNSIDFYTWNQGVDTSGTYGTKHVMTLDGNGNVGIGTTTPAYKLDAKGQVQIGADDNITPDALGNGHLMIDGSGYTGFASLDGTAMWVGHNSGSRNLYLATDETARLAITGGGNVGIGTTSPTYVLDANSSSYQMARFESSGAEVNVSLKSTSTNGRDYQIVSGGSGGAFAGGKFGIYDTAGGARLAIDSSGNVGIGTTSPAHDLHVAGGNKALVGGVFSTTSVAEHARLYLNDVNFGIGAGRFGSGPDDDLYLWAYNGAGRGIRFMRTTAGGSAVDSGAWVTSMEINNSGHVLTPSQPAFTARITTTGATYNAQVLPFSSASLNVGNHYNTSTYLFTAPVSGNYFFSYSVLVRTNGGTDRTETGFWKNGGWLMSRGNTYVVSDSASGHIHASSTVITYLAANDTMGIYQLQGATSDTYGGTSLSIFTGRLVS